MEIHSDFDWKARKAFKRHHPQAAPLSAEDVAELDALTEEAEALGDMADNDDELPTAKA